MHRHVRFDYQSARPTKTAHDVYEERAGVCRDFSHLALTFCRCLNIPARYATGYLGDIGIPPQPHPMDFSGWFEAYLDGRWYTFDARHNVPRIGRVLMAHGRDAVDVALTTSFGTTRLEKFAVWTDEVSERRARRGAGDAAPRSAGMRRLRSDRLAPGSGIGYYRYLTRPGVRRHTPRIGASRPGPPGRSLRSGRESVSR